MIRYIGYACINETLKPKKFRTCRLKTVLSEGHSFLRELILHNLELTLEILEWNVANNIYMYRASSDLLPLVTHPEVLDSYDWRWYSDDEIMEALMKIKIYVDANNIRLSMHPDQYTVLNSLSVDVVENSITYLKYHQRLLDAMGGSDMILHVGGVYGNKKEAMARFVHQYQLLEDGIKRYLRLENDDKSYNINEVLSISDETGVAVVFDYHHHRCLSMPPLETSVYNHVMQSWGNLIPKMHISSGRNHEKDRSHHDFIDKCDIEAVKAIYETDVVDVMVEAKKKELATLRMMKEL